MKPLKSTKTYGGIKQFPENWPSNIVNQTNEKMFSDAKKAQTTPEINSQVNLDRKEMPAFFRKNGVELSFKHLAKRETAKLTDIDWGIIDQRNLP